MKQVGLILLPILTTSAFAESNVFFGEKINSITLYGAQSTGSGTLLKLVQPGLWQINPQTILIAQYSQPVKFFRLDSRLNLNLGQNIGYESSHGLSFLGIGISIDSALFQYNNWYIGIGLGPFMRNKMDRWVESRLVFEEKVFIGKNISPNWNAEIFTVHYSNGNFTEKNAGFNFFGAGIGYKF